MLDALGTFLGGLRPGERLAIIFDEAQGLSDDALEELRLLSNYGRPGENQLQLILAGQPEILRRLMVPHLRQFNERIGARTLLVPLDANETIEYIDYRLRAKNGSAVKIFKRNALKYLVNASAGIPRRVNVLCHNSMLLAYAAGASQVTLKMAREAVTDYQDLFSAAIKASSTENPRPRGKWTFAWNSGLTAIAATIAGLLIALVALGSWAHRDANSQAVEAHEQDPRLPRTSVAPAHSARIDLGSSTTPIAVPDTQVEDSDSDTAASTDDASGKETRRASRLGKQKDSNAEGE
jgi:hypothetical protein